MVGKEIMDLYSWKQLAMWSLEHACLDDKERETIMDHWKILWEKFLDNVITWDEKEKEKEREKPSGVEEKSKM
jgi:adenosine deaminase CECR1